MTASRPAADACEFGSFWHGTLNPFAYACLASFPEAGASLRVFSYDPRLDLPPGVRLEDARAICPDQSLTRRFIANGKPSIATFADMFRYRMIRDTGYCWVDTDLLCLRKPAFGNDDFIFCRQADAVGTSLINNAVLRLPPSHPALAELLATAEAAIDVDQRWGAIGPFLLTPVLTKYGLYGRALEFPSLLSDRAGAVLEALLAGLPRLGRAAARGANSCICGAKRSCGAVTTSRSARPRAPTCTRRSGALARSTGSAASLSEDEVVRLMAKPIAESERAARPSAIASD